MSTALDIATTPAERARAFFHGISHRGVDDALKLVSADATVVIEPTHRAGGRGELAAFLTAASAAFSDLTITPQRVRTFPDGCVVAEVTFAGTQSAAFLGAPNQGKPVTLEQAWVLRSTGDEITSVTAYWDQTQLYRRLGVRRLDAVEVTA
jgi:steroid delta-isomerase-like uncharacterized protein